jgi:hypothetical protein
MTDDQPVDREASGQTYFTRVMSNDVFPKKVFIVGVALMAVAVLLGGHISRVVTEKLAPYVFFGIGEVRDQNITVTVHYRHSLTFSNGVTVSGLKRLPADLIFGVLAGVFILGFWFAFLRIAALLIRRHNPKFADDLLHFPKYTGKPVA